MSRPEVKLQIPIHGGGDITMVVPLDLTEAEWQMIYAMIRVWIDGNQRIANEEALERKSNA